MLLVVGGAAVLLAVATVAALPFFLTRLPAAYFVQPRRRPTGFFGVIILIIRNLLGIGLLLAGIAMLVLPGQGLLTILVALLLLDFPGKLRLERRIVAAPRVRKTINRLRARAGRPPLVLDDELPK